MITFSAPGKIILSGEHAVVYGYPAIAIAVNKRLSLKTILNKNNLSWQINSEIPARCGLGSSAALSAVSAAALVYLKTKKLNKEIINDMAFSLEKIHHGKPSGLDNTVSVYGGLIFYEKFKKFKSLKVKKLPEFLLINSGKPKETTKEMINLVASKPENKIILGKIGKLTQKFVKACKYSHLIKENERLLEDLGVVSQKAQKIIRQIEKLGAAAKICGAGGVKTGSGMILVTGKNLDLVKKFCRQNKLPYFMAKLENEGVRCE